MVDLAIVGADVIGACVGLKVGGNDCMLVVVVDVTIIAGALVGIVESFVGIAGVVGIFIGIAVEYALGVLGLTGLFSPYSEESSVSSTEFDMTVADCVVGDTAVADASVGMTMTVATACFEVGVDLVVGWVGIEL